MLQVSSHSRSNHNSIANLFLKRDRYFSPMSYTLHCWSNIGPLLIIVTMNTSYLSRQEKVWEMLVSVCCWFQFIQSNTGPELELLILVCFHIKAAYVLSCVITSEVNVSSKFEHIFMSVYNPGEINIKTRWCWLKQSFSLAGT